MTPRPFPIYDVFLDIPHPAVSTTSDANTQCGTIIIAPPPGPALEASMAVGKELVGDERAIARMARFAFPDFNDSIWGKIVTYNDFFFNKLHNVCVSFIFVAFVLKLDLYPLLTFLQNLSTGTDSKSSDSKLRGGSE